MIIMTEKNSAVVNTFLNIDHNLAALKLLLNSGIIIFKSILNQFIQSATNSRDHQTGAQTWQNSLPEIVRSNTNIKEFLTKSSQLRELILYWESSWNIIIY